MAISRWRRVGKVAAWTGGGLVVALAGAIALAWSPDLPLRTVESRWARPPSRFVTVDGLRIHLRDEGPRDDQTPIVLIHGTASHLHAWQGWANRLKETRRVIRFDRPGFGLTGSTPDSDYSIARNVAVTTGVLDRLGVTRAVVVGHSSGGHVAWAFAAAHPQRTAQLVLVAPAGYPRSTPLPMGLRVAMSPLAKPLIENLLPRSQVRRGLESIYGDPSKVTDAQVDRDYEITRRPGNRGALGAALRQTQGMDDWPRIRTIAMPTLILWGTKDTVIPVDPNAPRLARDIAGSALVLLPGVGHVPQEEAPDASYSALARFITRDERPDPR